jgi:hypothetical protein
MMCMCSLFFPPSELMQFSLQVGTEFSARTSASFAGKAPLRAVVATRATRPVAAQLRTVTNKVRARPYCTNPWAAQCSHSERM